MSGQSVEKDVHVVVDHHVASDNPRRWIGATWVEATCSCGAVVTNRNCKFFTTAFAAHVKSATHGCLGCLMDEHEHSCGFVDNLAPSSTRVTSPSEGREVQP